MIIRLRVNIIIITCIKLNFLPVWTAGEGPFLRSVALRSQQVKVCVDELSVQLAKRLHGLAVANISILHWRVYLRRIAAADGGQGDVHLRLQRLHRC
jgi:hypothetical protein